MRPLASLYPSGLTKTGLAWLTALLCMASWSQQARALDLLQAHAAARQNDPQFRAAIAEREAGAQALELGRAQMRPRISAYYNTNQNRAEITSGSGSVEERSYRSLSNGIQLQQPLMNFEALAARRQGAARAAASEARFAAREQELMLRLFEAYSTVLYAQDQLDQTQAQLAALAGLQRANEELLAKGEGTRTDVLETRAQHDAAIAQLIEAKDNLENARTRFFAITGLAPQSLDALHPDFSPLELPGQDFEQWQSLARDNNPLLQALRMEREAAREDRRRAQGGHMPRMDLIVSSGRSESDTLTTYRQKSRLDSVGIQLNIPLYSGGATSAQVRQAVALETQSQAELDARTGEVMTEVHKQFHLMSSSRSRLQAMERSRESATVLVEATRRSVAGGVRTNMDLLQAQERLARAERDLDYARYMHLLASMRLQAAAGTLSEDSLRTIATRFAPSSKLEP